MNDVHLPINCLSPIRAPVGSPIPFYPCGKCAACLSNSISRSQRLLQYELSLHKYTLFILLTYRDGDIPTYELTFDYSDGDYISAIATQGNSYLSRFTLTLDDFNEFSSIYAKQHGRSLELPITPCQRYTFYSLCYDHVRAFFKRLRRSLEKRNLSGFSYAMCGEYGPTTFRPHYHLLLFFDDFRTFSYVREHYYTRWEHGFTNFQDYAGTDGRYITQYLTGSSSYAVIRRFLPQFRPRFLHSNHLGFERYSRMSKGFSLSQQTRYSDLPFLSVPSSRGIQSVLPHVSYLASEFPKCPGLLSLPIWSLCRAYSIAFEYPFRSFLRSKESLLTDVVHSLITLDDDNRFDYLRSYLPAGWSGLLQGSKVDYLYSEQFSSLLYRFWLPSLKLLDILLRDIGINFAYSDLYCYVNRIRRFYLDKGLCDLGFYYDSIEQLSKSKDSDVIYNALLDDSCTDNPLYNDYANSVITRLNRSVKTKKLKDKYTSNIFYNYVKQK